MTFYQLILIKINQRLGFQGNNEKSNTFISKTGGTNFSNN